MGRRSTRRLAWAASQRLAALRSQSCFSAPSWGAMNSGIMGSAMAWPGATTVPANNGMVVLGLAITTPARQALWAAELSRAEVFGAVQRDQHTAAEPLKGAQPAMPAQHIQGLVEGGLQVRGMHWVEHGADMIVGRHGRHAEQALAVRHLPPFLQRALVAEERLALHEKQRKG